MSYFLFIPLSLRSLVRLSLQVSLGVNLYGVRRMCHVAAATQSAQLRPLRRQTCPLRYLPLRCSGQRSRLLNYGVQERQQVPNVSSAAPHTFYHRSSQLGLTGSPGSKPKTQPPLGGRGAPPRAQLAHHGLRLGWKAGNLLPDVYQR